MVRHAYVIPSTTDEQALVTYHKRFTPKESTTIHKHKHTVRCIRQGCYSLVKQI